MCVRQPVAPVPEAADGRVTGVIAHAERHDRGIGIADQLELAEL